MCVSLSVSFPFKHIHTYKLLLPHPGPVLAGINLVFPTDSSRNQLCLLSLRAGESALLLLPPEARPKAPLLEPGAISIT